MKRGLIRGQRSTIQLLLKDQVAPGSHSVHRLQLLLWLGGAFLEILVFRNALDISRSILEPCCPLGEASLLCPWPNKVYSPSSPNDWFTDERNQLFLAPSESHRPPTCCPLSWHWKWTLTHIGRRWIRDGPKFSPLCPELSWWIWNLRDCAKTCQECNQNCKLWLFSSNLTDQRPPKQLYSAINELHLGTLTCALIAY